MTSTNLSPRQLNFAHLVLACVDLNKPLKDILHIYIKPKDLVKEVQSNQFLMKGNKLNSEQKSKCGLAPPKLPDYSQFDLTLLYTLIRNLCSGSLTPTKGWGKEPQATDIEPGDDIERIRVFRNKNFAHVNSGELDDTTFEGLWSNLEDIIKRIQSFTKANGCQSDYLQQLANLKGRPVEIDEYTSVVELLKEIRTAVPWNVKEIYEDDVSNWKKDDEVYFETHNFQAMIEQVKNQPYVTFVGTPGSGKSATAHHIALKLQDEDEYEILPIKDIKDIETYCDPNNPQVFVIDDVVGVLEFDLNQFKLLGRYKNRITSPKMPSSKIIMTCREIIFKNNNVTKSFLNKEMHVIQLQGNENRLTDDDKRFLLEKYNLDRDLIPSEKISETSNMFPFLCKMYPTQTVKDADFFITPIQFIKAELDKMQIQNQIHYASLVLLMINGNKLSKEDFEEEIIENNFTQKKNDVLISCEIGKTTDSFEFTCALKAMVGTYTQARGLYFCFIHDSLYEIVACHFGCKFPKPILNYMSIGYISYYIKFVDAAKDANEIKEKDVTSKDKERYETDDVTDVHFKLQKSYLPMLADRLFKELGNGLFYAVFSALKKDSSKRWELNKIIKKKTYAEIKTTFLLEHNSVDRTIVWSLESLYSRKRIVGELHNEVSPAMLFPNGFKKDTICLRPISLVVLLGFNDIFEHIMDKMLESNGNTHDLFHIPGKNGKEGGNVTKHENAEDDFTPTKLTKIKKTSHGFHMSGLCCVRNTYVDTQFDYNTTSASAKHSGSDSDSENEYIDTILEPDIVEQLRLLYFSCFSGDFYTFRSLMKHVTKTILDNLSDIRLNISHGVSKCLNPLDIADTSSCIRIARELIKAGAEVNQSMLFNGIKMSLLMLLLKAGTNRYNDADKETHDVFYRIDRVKKIIQNGHDVNLYDELQKATAFYDNKLKVKKNQTPLMIACQERNHCTVKALIKAGADVNLGNEHETPVMAACRGGCLNVIEELWIAGANINTKDLSKLDFQFLWYNLELAEFAQQVIEGGTAVDLNSMYQLLLTYACEEKNIVVVDMLLNKGAGVNLVIGNRTPLISALKREIYESKFKSNYYKTMMDIIKLLIKNRADVNLNTRNETPLIVACHRGRHDLVKELIEAGADVNLKAKDETPLIVACSGGKHDVVKELIKAGASVDLKSGDETPLIVACRGGKYEVVKELIEAGANVDLKSGDKTPLIVACNRFFHDIVKELIKAGADVNLNTGTQAPLTVAFNKHNTNAIKELIKAGADINLKVGDKTLVTIACQKGYTDVVEEIIRKEFDLKLGAQDKTPQTDACDKAEMNAIDGFENVGTNIDSEQRHESQSMAACLSTHLYKAEMLYKAGGSVNCTDGNDALLTSKCLMEHLRKVENIIKSYSFANQKDVECIAMKSTCCIGHLSLVKELIKGGADFDSMDGDETPLIIACQEGHVNVVYELIEAGADVNLKTGSKSPFTVACKELQIEIVKELVKANVDVNLEVNHETALTYACNLYAKNYKYAKEVFSVIEEITKAGANVNKRVGDKTPFISACRKGHIDLVKLFLKYNANVNLAAGGSTPLICACLGKHLDVVEVLLKANANVNLNDVCKTPLTAAISDFSIQDLQLVKTLVKAGADVNLGDKESTPLILACKGGHIRLTATLIRMGAKVNRKAEETSSLSVACTEGHIGVIKELLKAGAHVNQKVGGKTPLQIAYDKNSMKIVEMLVNAKASCNYKVGVISPITIACFIGNINKVKSLLKSGTELDVIDNNEKTPLTAACQKGYLSIVKELIKAGANVNFKDKYNTPLTTACSWGHLDIVKELIKAGCDVNRIDICYTPLTIACFWGEMQIVIELIASGADVNLQDKKNTPLIVACLKDRRDIVRELIKANADVNQEASGNTPLTAAIGYSGIVQELVNAGANVNLGIKFGPTLLSASQNSHSDKYDQLFNYDSSLEI